MTKEQNFLLQVLSDDEKKSLYDRYGEAGLKGAGGMGGMGVRCSDLQIYSCIDTRSQLSDHFLVWLFLY